MGYIKFFKLFFQNLFVDLTPVCDSPIDKKTVTQDHTTFRPKQDLVGASEQVAARNTRTPLFTSSNSKRSLSTISKRRRHNNRRTATPPKRKNKSIFDTSAEESDISMSEEQQQPQTRLPVVNRTRGRKDRNYNYKRYLARVLRNINAESNKSKLTISSQAMECMSNFMVDIFDKIAQEAGQQVKKNKTKTLGDWDIRSAVKIVIPGELGRHANINGQQKLENMYSHKMNKKKKVVTFNPEIECFCPM